METLRCDPSEQQGSPQLLLVRSFIVQDDLQTSVVHHLCEGLSFIIRFPGIQELSQCPERGLHGAVLSLRYWKTLEKGLLIHV